LNKETIEVEKNEQEEAELKAIGDKIKPNIMINFDAAQKKSGKFEMDMKLNELISSGEGVNLTLFNYPSQPAR